MIAGPEPFPPAGSHRKEGEDLRHMKNGFLCVGIAALVLIVPTAWAATELMAAFRGLEIPFDLMNGDDLIAKGKYDLEVHFSKVDTNYLYLLRLMRKGQYLHEVKGGRIEYQAQTIQDLMKDPKIPKDPTLRFRRLPESDIVDIIFESGKTSNFPFEKAFFRLRKAPD
jgi:hypothetical protein